MFLMVEKGIRGGVSYIANRYSKPNNKYLEDYDENKESSYFIYLDANNIYGYEPTITKWGIQMASKR